MNKKQRVYEQLAKTLADLFTPMLEVSLYEQKKLISVFNRLTNDPLQDIEANTPVKILINKNQQAKLLVIPLEDDYSLRLIVDTSLFASLQDLLNIYLIKQVKGADATHWQHLMERAIGDYLSEHGASLAALSMQEKRSLVLLLQEKDLLRYQDATKYLANKLNVSRATIYNYLNQANQFKSLEIHQVDAFTDEPFSGNPAGVVLDANQLSDTTMKKIAREMNLSETSFLLNSKKADIKLRYFTPNGSEVKFCGHSTVGALYMLAHRKLLGMERAGKYPIQIETGVGIVSAAVSLKSDESITVQFTAPKAKMQIVTFTHAEMVEALGISLASIDQRKPIMYEKINQDLFITAASLEALENLQIDQEGAKRFAEKHHIVAYSLVSNETLSKRCHIHMRCFAPLVGIPEDPFTGSVLGGLSVYIQQNNLITKGLKTVRVEQGHFINRPGYVDLILSSQDESPLIVAKAHHFFSTKINL